MEHAWRRDGDSPIDDHVTKRSAASRAARGHKEVTTKHRRATETLVRNRSALGTPREHPRAAAGGPPLRVLGGTSGAPRPSSLEEPQEHPQENLR